MQPVLKNGWTPLQVVLNEAQVGLLVRKEQHVMQLYCWRYLNNDYRSHLGSWRAKHPSRTKCLVYRRKHAFWRSLGWIQQGQRLLFYNPGPAHNWAFDTASLACPALGLAPKMQRHSLKFFLQFCCV